MKHTIIHDTPSWTIERSDAMTAASTDMFAGRDGMCSALSSAAKDSFTTSTGHSRVSVILAAIAALLGVWLFTACSDTPPDVPVDPIIPAVVDTSSRDFVWTVDTIGIELSWINDVTIISENDVWVVGQFDQRGDDGRYDVKKRGNAAHWDGEKWTIRNITDGTYVGGGAMELVFATSPQNIWIMSSGGLHFDGSRWTLHDFTYLKYYLSTQSMWVSNDESVRVFVALGGNLIYYRDGKYIKHPSPPPYDFASVDGFSNGDVLIGGGHVETGGGLMWRMSKDGIFTPLYTKGKFIMRFVDVVNDEILCGTNRDIYHFDGTRLLPLFSTSVNIRGMKANALNDVFMITNSSTVYHYNGVNTKDIGPEFPGDCMGMGLCVQGDLIYVVALGENQRCLVFRGERRK